jgi:serine/threonine protein kinase
MVMHLAFGNVTKMMKFYTHAKMEIGSWRTSASASMFLLSPWASAFTSNGWGTNGYMAPELLLSGDDKIRYSRKVDIWSLGCILYELVVGRQLFQDNYYARRCIDTGVLPEITFDESFGDDDKERIRCAFNKMLSLDPDETPAAEDLVKEFSSNYIETTSAAASENIEIHHEFIPTRHASVTHAEITTQPKVGTTSSKQEVHYTAVTSAKFTTTTQVGPLNQEAQPALKFEEKIELVLTEIEEDPSNFWSWYALSTLYASDSEGNIKSAIEACQLGLERFPKSPSINMELTKGLDGTASPS